MKALGKTWGYDELNEFLTSPKAYVAGTKMSFAGYGKADDRIATIAYLKSISPNAPAAVSYTHLDVYKRQLQRFRTARGHNQGRQY